MQRLLVPICLLLAASLVVVACAAPAAAPAAPASAPAGTEAVSEGAQAGAGSTEAGPGSTEAVTEAAAAAATEPAEAAPTDKEAPPVVPADSAAEATEAPAAGTRVFQIAPDQSTAGYSVEEEFFGQGMATAVGTTSAITGQVTLQFDQNSVALAANQFTVDISTLKTDRPRRDQAIRDHWLESSKYRLATFVATSITDLPAGSALGQEVSFKVNGDLTIRGVTNPVTWDITAKVDGNTLSGTAVTSILMRDFGFDPPNIAGMLSVTDGVTLTVQFVAHELQ